MTRAEKEKQVAEIEDRVQRSKVTIFTDFCGLSVKEMEELRKQFREVKVEYKVYKNTLISRAFEGRYQVDHFLREPTALAFSFDDISVPAKIITNFAKEKPALKIKGGLVEGQIMDKAGIEKLAELPSKEELLARIVWQIRSPIQGLVNVINGPLVKLIMVLKAIEENKKTK